MSLLSTADLTMMRGIIDDLLPDTCNILSESLTSDGQGGVTSTWGVTASAVACRLDSATKQNQGLTVIADGVRPEHEYYLSLPHDTEIVPGDRVEIGAYTFTVTTVNEGVSWVAVKRATLKIYSRDANAVGYGIVGQSFVGL